MVSHQWDDAMRFLLVQGKDGADNLFGVRPTVNIIA
jgi:hypothetical protein